MRETRLDGRSVALRGRIIDSIESSRRGHIASAFSLLEIVRVLYDDVLRYDAARPDWAERDRFVLSKGHGCLALYVMLADKGFIPGSELERVCEFDAMLGGHPEHFIPGVEASTGSLGHGLSIAVGIAIAARIDRAPHRIFALVGDGECAEGAIWEAALSASKNGLSNLTVLVDRNRFQCYGPTEKVGPLDPFADKWRSFNFAVRECDGHEVRDLQKQLSEVPYQEDRPSVLICNTVKGKGVKIMENNPDWHHSNKVPDETIAKLRADLEAQAL